MKITLFGATGNAGRYILAELLAAGHEVTAVVRTPERVAARPGLHVVAGNVLQPESIEPVIAGADAIVSTISEGLIIQTHTQSRGMVHIVRTLQQCGVNRLIALAAFGILQATESSLNYQQPWFPSVYQPISEEHRVVWQTLQASPLAWTLVCPPVILPQPANGRYLHQAATMPGGPQQVSGGNLGAFIVAELAAPQYVHQRVGIWNG